ncbi:MAG: MarR family winged helix-turn-helix transcriptional regulator [Acidobacteriota bacterium]
MEHAPQPAADLGLLRDLVGFNLRLTYNRAALLFSKAFADLDLAPIQFAALEFIANNPECSQKDIACHIGTAPSALVSPLERLEKRGWIQRLRGAADRRRARVSLSATGKRQVVEIERRIREVDRELVSGLPAEKQRQLLALLQDLADTL